MTTRNLIKEVKNQKAKAITNNNTILLEKVEHIESILMSGGNLCFTCPNLKNCPGCRNKVLSRIKYS